MRPRPIGVLVIAIYYFLGGAAFLALAIYALMGAVDTSRLPFGGADAAKYVLLGAIIVAAIGGGYVATAWGLWQLRQWAQAAAIVVAGIGVLLVLSFLVVLTMAGNFIPIQLYVLPGLYGVLSLGIIAYLLTPGVAALFGPGETMPLGTCPRCLRSGIRPDMSVCPYCRQSLFASPPTPPDGDFPGGGGFVSEPTVPDANVVLDTTHIAEPRASVLGWLVVTAGPDAGKRMDLLVDTAIGRDTKCQIKLNDEYVSRQHARVKFESGQFFIYDVGSSGGTFVNGHQVQRLMLYDGAEIRLGNTTMEFKKTAPAR